MKKVLIHNIFVLFVLIMFSFKTSFVAASNFLKKKELLRVQVDDDLSTPMVNKISSDRILVDNPRKISVMSESGFPISQYIHEYYLIGFNGELIKEFTEQKASSEYAYNNHKIVFGAKNKLYFYNLNGEILKKLSLSSAYSFEKITILPNDFVVAYGGSLRLAESPDEIKYQSLVLISPDFRVIENGCVNSKVVLNDSSWENLCVRLLDKSSIGFQDGFSLMVNEESFLTVVSKEEGEIIYFIAFDGENKKQIKNYFRVYTPILLMNSGDVLFNMAVLPTQWPSLIPWKNKERTIVKVLSENGKVKTLQRLTDTVFNDFYKLDSNKVLALTSYDSKVNNLAYVMQSSGEPKEISFKEGIKGSFPLINGDFIVLTKTGLFRFNSNGEEINSRDLSLDLGDNDVNEIIKIKEDLFILKSFKQAFAYNDKLNKITELALEELSNLIFKDNIQNGILGIEQFVNKNDGNYYSSIIYVSE